MKLFGLEISKIQNASKPMPTMADLLEFIQKPQQQIYRTQQEIVDFKMAVTTAENNYNPNRYLLYKLYNDVILDSHLSACIQQRKNLTLGRDFKVVGKDGKEIEELTKLIKTKWFRDVLDMSLDSIFWGYSLIQFEDLINNSFKCVELIPRLYVKPEKHIVVKAWSDIDGQDYLEEPFVSWCMGVGNPKDLGLLMKAAPLIIWKKNAMGAWSDFQNKFGSPAMIAKTDVSDKASQNKIDEFLANFQRSPYARLPKDSMVEILQTSKQDAHQVFDALIERCNSEISKLILGQTGTTAEKSFVGSAEVHERILGGYGELDEHFIEGVLNYQLIPLMENLGISFNGAKIECDESEDLVALDQIKVDDVLLKYYDIPESEILDSYGRVVTKKVAPVVDKGFTNSIDEYYV